MDIKKHIEETNYQNYVKQSMPKSHLLKECVMAFIVGGLICVLGEALNDLGEMVFRLDEDGVNAFRSAVLIFLGALFTGIGIYDVLGRFAGAGSIVPITGFANSIVSPALEYKWEGYVLGVGAKLFTIAGPVLVYGISSSIIVGVIYYIIGVV
ncbi:MAG: stage V sporulation protein AC [Christensenellaceae bacterium]|nr:stage V sporulation protein AC [Christensenellaceae bacterium]